MCVCVCVYDTSQTYVQRTVLAKALGLIARSRRGEDFKGSKRFPGGYTERSRGSTARQTPPHEANASPRLLSVAEIMLP